ncbi:hypothetical protein B0H21DRAFT_696309 [Amylocystis lapponica]|nr:hypothetical protein B0H21DRAFT_696309 [Amylocystis lapponica]
MAQFHDVPPSALAANWDPEILANYLESSRSARDSDVESAMSTDSEHDAPPSSPPTSNASAPIAMRAADIASDDDAFSSDDEIATDKERATQRARRELVLGRPARTVVGAGSRDLVEMHLGYMRQLDCADEELAELRGVPYEALVRRGTVSGYTAPVKLDGEVEAVVQELRMRSMKEIAESERPDLVRGLVLLAQAQFRKEREIKRLYGPGRIDDSLGDEDED